MAFLAFYKDPKKKRLQQIEVLLLLVSLPFVLVLGSKSAKSFADFREAEAYYQAGDEALHAGKVDEAMRLFDKALEVYPEFYGAWEGLGASLHLRGEHERELDVYRRAVTAIPEKGELRRELATAYHEVGDHKAELREIRIASEILGTDEIFTSRLLSRAEREGDGRLPIPDPDKMRAPGVQKVPDSAKTEFLRPAFEHEEHHDHSEDH